MTNSANNDKESHPLVDEYLERISSKVFSEYPQQLTKLIGQRHGVYALYKGKKLYYVGLASNLRRRIKHHLNDVHAGKWNRFSLYLIRSEHHIKEIESLVLRIADPKGNTVAGKLPVANDLSRDLRQQVQLAQKKKLDNLFKEKPRPSETARQIEKEPQKRSNVAGTTRTPTLAPYCSKPFKIKRMYKGEEYSAGVSATGQITYNKVNYNSPSVAAYAITNRPTNGWTFWKYMNAEGEWVKLDTLRK